MQRPVIRRTSLRTDARGMTDDKDGQDSRLEAQRRVSELVRKILGPAGRRREQTNTQSSSSASNQSIDIPEEGPLTHRLEEGLEEGTEGLELHAAEETRPKSPEQGSSKGQGRDKE